MKRVISFALVAAVALAGSTAYAGGPTNGGCGKDIEKNVGKVTAATIKQVAKVNADYAKLVDKEGSSPSDASMDKLAEKTQKGWDKVWASNGKSAVDKGILALTGLVGKGKCDDSTLAANGHVPPSVAGNFWANLAVTKAVQDGINAAQQREAGAYAAMKELGDTGLCPGCTQGFNGFCKIVPIPWGPGSVSELYGQLDLTVASTLAINLSAQVNTNVLCRSDWLGPNILGVTSAGVGQFTPIGVGPSLAAACVRPVNTVGWINCNSDATHPAVDFTVCQNHDVAAGGDCSTGATFCFADQLQDDGTTASGACYSVTTSAPSAGDAFIASQSQISTCTGDVYGPDGLPCTGDEVGCTINAPGNTWTTSGSGSLTILNTDIPVSSGARVGDDAVVNFGPGTPYSLNYVPATGAPAVTADICDAMFANANGPYQTATGDSQYSIEFQLGGGFTSINSLFDVDTINMLTVVNE